MKKYVLTVLGLMIFSLTLNGAFAAKTTSQQTADAIKYYKAKDYTQSYYMLNKVLQEDASNALATYYYAMSAAQLGKKDEALLNYDRVINLASKSVLSKYAKKGKKCIETPERCSEPDKPLYGADDTDEDRFIKGVFGSGFSEAARGVHEKQKIDNLKRDINKNKDIPAQRFKEYKDFSSQAPTNDEIVMALRTLQAAGLTDVLNTSLRNSDLSLMMGNGYDKNNVDYGMLNALLNNKNASGVDAQLIQSLLTTQMTTNF